QRFRLAQNGRDLDPSSYADFDGPVPARIRSRDVTSLLRRGATLAFHAADEVHDPLRRMAESFEAAFHGGTQINVYAGWHSQPGLDVRFDEEEVVVLQFDGRKRWLLYGCSWSGRRAEDGGASASDAVFDDVLNPGDLLYVPRGCYHVAVPLNEPVLHLTVGI